MCENFVDITTPSECVIGNSRWLNATGEETLSCVAKYKNNLPQPG